MKRILIAFFACVLCLCFCGICAAENNPSTTEGGPPPLNENPDPRNSGWGPLTQGRLGEQDSIAQGEAENNPSVESVQGDTESSPSVESVQGDIENSPSVESEGEERDLKEYITDKILPIIIGVATSSFGFVAVLGTISRTLKSLKDTKESFSSEAKKRQEAFDEATRLLKEKTEELKALVRDVPQLTDKLKELSEENELVAEILTLGFSANTEIIKSGKGKRMSVLLEKAKAFSSNDIRSQEVADDIPAV